jgi:hypothetical protein
MQVGDNRPAANLYGFDCDRCGEDTGEECMQRTAVVGVIPVLITVTISGPGAVTMMMHVLMVSVGSDRVGKSFRTRQRRRHHAGKLGDQE